jgi:hypothetical protein
MGKKLIKLRCKKQHLGALCRGLAHSCNKPECCVKNGVCKGGCKCAAFGFFAKFQGLFDGALGWRVLSFQHSSATGTTTRQLLICVRVSFKPFFCWLTCFRWGQLLTFDLLNSSAQVSGLVIPLVSTVFAFVKLQQTRVEAVKQDCFFRALLSVSKDLIRTT